ncbi:MAG: DNA-binding protein [Methanophagales archaeon]|nr:DNA-binding protein [Methanophagales archaeon]
MVKEEIRGTKSGTGKGNALRKEVIVDTNALLIPGEFGVDIFDELERLGYLHIIVPRVVLKELDKLRKRPGLKGKEKRAANVGYSLLQRYTPAAAQRDERVTIRSRISIEEAAGEEEEKDTDEIITALALKRKAAVLTNDENLRTKLSQAGITTVYLRGRNRLEEGE